MGDVEAPSGGNHLYETVTSGLIALSPESQISALQLLREELLEDRSPVLNKESRDQILSLYVPRIKNILQTSQSSSVQAEALQCLTKLYPEYLAWYDIMGPISSIIFSGEEFLMLHAADLLEHIIGLGMPPDMAHECAEVEAMLQYGVVDALCVRITSTENPSTAMKLLSMLLSAVRLSTETLDSETPFLCAATILSQKEGVLSHHEVQLACLELLKTCVEPSSCVVVVGFVKAGLVPLLMDRLKTEQRPKVRMCIVGIFINLSFYQQSSKAMLQAGLFDVLLVFLMANNNTDDMYDVLFWLVGKITGDSLEMRDLTIRDGVVEDVVKVASADGLAVTIRQRLMRLLAIFFRPDPQGVPTELVKKMLKILKISLSSQDEKLQLDALYGLHCLTVLYKDVSFRGVELVTEMGFIPCLMGILHGRDKVQSRSALGVVCNIAKSQEDKAIRALLDNGLLQFLSESLPSSEDVFEKVVILQSIAKCGYCEEIFHHISVQLFVDTVSKFSIEVGSGLQCLLELFLTSLKQGQPVVLQTLSSSSLQSVLQGLEEDMSERVASHYNRSLSQLTAEIEECLTEVSRKNALPTDSGLKEEDSCVPMDF